MEMPPRRTTMDKTPTEKSGNVRGLPPESKEKDPVHLQESTQPRPDDGGEGTLSGVPREIGGHRDPKPASADD
jgi:hypothetical protein